MNRVKKNRHYLFLFALLYIGIYILIAIFQALLANFFNFIVPFASSVIALFSAMFVSRIFYRHEGRFPDKPERKKLIIGCLLVWLAITFIVSVLAVAIILLTCLLYTSPSPRDRG